VANTNRATRISRSPLPSGSVAPAIVLPAGHARTWALRDFRGRPVVLVFYPADWEPVSADQLRRYNDVLPEVRSLGAELEGVPSRGRSSRSTTKSRSKCRRTLTKKKNVDETPAARPTWLP
jgi:peroxiredoxin